MTTERADGGAGLLGKPRQAGRGRASVGRIANKRMPVSGEMNANLVRAPRV